MKKKQQARSKESRNNRKGQRRKMKEKEITKKYE